MVPEAIRHESILAIGYFVMGNKENQLWIHQGEQPTILNQLCMLPFQYFSEPVLKGILFPTLVSSLFLCDEAKEIVRNEVSLIHMASYLTGSFFLSSLQLSTQLSDSIEQVTSESETLVSEAEKWRLKNVDRWLLYHRFHVDLFSMISIKFAFRNFLSTMRSKTSFHILPLNLTIFHAFLIFLIIRFLFNKLHILFFFKFNCTNVNDMIMIVTVIESKSG